MGMKVRAVEADRQRNFEVAQRRASPRINLTGRVLAPLGAAMTVPYVAPGADLVTYDAFDPRGGAPLAVAAAGVFEAFASLEPAYHRVSAWWGATSLRRTIAVEGWRRPFLLIERRGDEAFEPAMMPQVSGFTIDLIWVQRNVCEQTPPAFDEWPMPPVVSGLVVLARLRVVS